MSDRRAPRPTLLATGIRALALAAVLAAPAMADNAAKADTSAARPANTLQSLAELDGKAPSRRQLNIQHWSTAEAPVCYSWKPANCRCSTCASPLPPAAARTPEPPA